MHIPPFELERYFARYEFNAPFLLCCSDCETFSVGELLALEDGAADAFLNLRLGYTEAEGAPDLRAAIAGLYDSIQPTQVLVHSGAEEAIFNFMNAVLSPGDHVVVQWPCYQSLFQVAAAVGCETSKWEMREASGWGLDLNELADLIRPQTRLVVINRPHNPTGMVGSMEDVRALQRLSEERGFIVFSDEVYRFLEYDPTDRAPAFSDLSESAVSLGVMSKTFGLPGLRIGWIATRNRDVFRRMAAFKDYTTICNSAPSEFLATLALDHREVLVERNRSIIRTNLSVLEDFMVRHGDRIRWIRPQGGPIAFPSLRDDADAEAFCRNLVERTGVLLLPGFVYGENFRSNFRLGFGRRNMAECLTRLADFLDHGA